MEIFEITKSENSTNNKIKQLSNKIESLEMALSFISDLRTDLTREEAEEYGLYIADILLKLPNNEAKVKLKKKIEAVVKEVVAEVRQQIICEINYCLRDVMYNLNHSLNQ